jgi:hypothetical protein
MSTGEGWLTLPDFFVEAQSAPVAQEKAVAVYWTGRTLAGPVDFAVHNPDTDDATPGQIMIKNHDPQVLQYTGGVFKLTGTRSVATPGV